MAGKIFGLAKWILDADNRKLNRKAKESEEAIKDVGEAADKSAQKVSKLGKAGEGIDKRTEGVRKFTGAIGAGIGVASAAAGAIIAVVNAVKAVRDYMEDGAKVADRFFSSLDTVNETEAAYKQLQDRLQAVSSELEAKDAGGLAARAGRNRKQIEEEAEALRSKLVAVNKQIQAQRKQREREEIEAAQREAAATVSAFLEAASAASDRQGLSLLPEDEQIIATAQLARKEFRKAAQEAGVDLDSEQVQRRIALIDEEEKRKYDAMLERIAAEKRASEERMAAERESTIKAAQDAAEAYAKQLTRSTGDFTTRLDSILNAVRDVSRVSGRR